MTFEARIIIESISKAKPNIKALFGFMLPLGKGLLFVLFIRASISLSKKWFSTAEPAEAKPVPRRVQKTSHGSGKPLCAKYIPVRVVIKTRSTMPGFVRTK